MLLVAITAVWGSTFFLIRDVVQVVPPTDFLAVRFTIAAVAMVAVFWRPLWALGKRELRIGVGLGVLYAVAQILQTVGLAHTEAARSGFITGTYVVLTPIFAAILLRDRIPRSTWFAVLMATAGLAMLSLNDLGAGGSAGFGFGEGVTLLAAAVYALHIIGLGRYSSPAKAAGLSSLQMVAIAAVSLVAAAPGGIELPTGRGGWAAVLYMALVAGAGGGQMGLRPGLRPDGHRAGYQRHVEHCRPSASTCRQLDPTGRSRNQGDHRDCDHL